MLEGQAFTFDATNPPGRLAQFMRMVASLDSRELGRAIDGMIERLDQRDGDPDLEATGLEDDFATYPPKGPGCPIGDGGTNATDTSWPEWHTRGRHKLTAFGAESGLGFRGDVREDDENDDPAEDGGDEGDGNGSEDDFMRHQPDGPGCPIADPVEAAYPERIAQPSYMMGGLAGEWWNEDAEPWRVPAMMDRAAANCNQVRA